MPTILLLHGWRFYIYPNEGNEPMHVHAEKGEKECKYWLDSKKFSVEEDYTYNMNGKDKRQVQRIIFDYFELIEEVWVRLHGKD